MEIANKYPLPGATVEIKALSLSTVTDENGVYIIRDIPLGEYSIEASMPGFRTQVKTRVLILPNRTFELDFELEETSLESHEVTVYPEYFIKNKDENVSSSRLTYYEVRGDPEGYNLPRTLSSLHSVGTAEDYSASIIVRGGSPDENLTLIDHIEVDSPVHFPNLGGGGGGMTIINTELIKDVTFSSGGFPARYGGKLSSFMDISLREGKKDKIGSSFDFSMAGVSFIIEGPLRGKTSFIVNYRKSFFEILDKFSDIGDVVPNYDDYYARLDLNINPENKAWIFWIGGKDYMEVPETMIFASDKLVWKGNQNIIGLNWRSLIGEKGFLITTLAFINNTADLIAGREFELQNNRTRSFAKASISYELNKAHLLEMGMQIGTMELSYKHQISSHRSPTGLLLEEEVVEGAHHTYPFSFIFRMFGK